MLKVFRAKSSWQPDKDFLLEHLPHPKKRRLYLDRFPLGVDNVHIDVVFTPDLTKVLSQLVNQIVRREILRFWNSSYSRLRPEPGQVFQRIHTAISRVLLHEESGPVRAASTQLYQLALLSLVLGMVDKEIATVKNELENARRESSANTRGSALKLHERLVILAKKERTVRFRACRHLILLFSEAERTALRKLRKSIIGQSWPVYSGMLFNPLLQLDGMGTANDFSLVYPQAYYDDRVFQQVNLLVIELLRPWLPDFVLEVATSIATPDSDELADRKDQGKLRGYVEIERRMKTVIAPAEYESGRSSWLDRPDNMIRLFGGVGEDWPQPGPWDHPDWPSFQRSLMASLEKALHEAGLMRPLLASQMLTDIGQELNLSGHSYLLFNVLCNANSRRDIIRQLRDLPESGDVTHTVNLLDQGIKSIRQYDESRHRRNLLQMMARYSRLRRDLKWAWEAYSAMDSIRILMDEDEIELSRSNRLLQTFCQASSADKEGQPVIGHVIIKADIRGSTGITSRMLEKDLNPAAYFSRNLFDPINKLLHEFSATKVFVEGDAVIMTILQYRDNDSAGPVVARACKLAEKILRMVVRKNRQSIRYNLPELELGIGITYTEGAPAYLYDEGRRITISPAINRADRLSSCHPGLRTLNPKTADTNHVEVVIRGDKQDSDCCDSGIVRYNVNGVEMEAAAFTKLQSEIVMRRISLDDGQKDVYWHVGRYSDVHGGDHWLVVRDAPVRRWQGGEVLSAGADPLRFYELVTDAGVLSELRRQLS